jgi:hypothetical protein
VGVEGEEEKGKKLTNYLAYNTFLPPNGKKKRDDNKIQYL